MAVQDKFILAIDLGTSGPKVALFSTRGELVDQDFEPSSLQLLPDGGAEQSPDEWWRVISTAVKRMLARQVVPSEEVMAVGITGQWSGTVAVDKQGNALGNAVIWYDSRGAPYVEKIAGGALKVGGYSATKLARWLNLTGGVPGNAGKDPVAHILFLKNKERGLYHITDKFLEPIDYIGLRLTGCAAASFDSVTLYWVTDNRNLKNVRYDDALIRISELDKEKLPELKPADAVLGTLLPQVASEWGLRSDVKVIMGSPDTHSAAVGAGAVRDYDCHYYVGTGSWLVFHYPTKKTDLNSMQAALPSAIPGRYIVIDSQECGGACLQYLRNELLNPNDALSSGKEAKVTYEQLNAVAAQTRPGSGKLVFTPWLYGERSPVDDRTVRGGFFNQSLQTTRADMVRAVYEGVAYNARWTLSQAEPFMGRKVEAINMVGGGAQSDTWCQIHADVLNRTIRKMKDPVQANVRGAALLASAALGYVRYDDIPSCVPVEKEFTPNAANREIYDELFREFQEIYKRNKKAYARLNRL